MCIGIEQGYGKRYNSLLIDKLFLSLFAEIVLPVKQKKN